MALYVYGIMRLPDAARASQDARNEVALQTVEYDQVGALVSPTPGTELRLRRENIFAHADVLQAAFESGPVLPFRFGTVVADAEAVRGQLLAPSADRFASRLDALDGKAELQLKAVYAEEPLLRSILAEDKALARSAQRTQALPAPSTHFERIRIGEAIASAVQARGATDGQTLMAALAPLAITHVISAPHHERAILNAAFLVDQENLSRFDRAVEVLSEEHAGVIEFKLIGPMPAYSFADQDWKTNATEEQRAWA